MTFSRHLGNKEMHDLGITAGGGGEEKEEDEEWLGMLVMSPMDTVDNLSERICNIDMIKNHLQAQM